MGYSSLYRAVYNKDISEVRRLLGIKTVDKNEKNSNGWTPLILAAEKGYEDIVQELLKVKEVSINAMSEKQGTAVFEAARGRNWHIVRILARRNAQVYIPTEDHETALQYAVRNGMNMIASLLLDKGADKTIDEKESQRGDTALHLAVRRGSLYLCRRLARAVPSSKNVPNEYDETARDLAIRLRRSQNIIDAVT